MVSARTVCGPSPSRPIVTPAWYESSPDPEFRSPRQRRTPSAGRPLPGAGGWSVAVQHFGLVLVPRGRRPVRVDDQRPAPAVDDDLVVEGPEQDAVLDGGLAAVGLVPGVVDLAGAGGLGAAGGPLAVPVPQQHRVADPGRDRLGVPDVQRQARPAEAGAELPPPPETPRPPRAG